MANALLSHWTVSARADVVCAQTLPHRSSNFHLTRNTWSNNKPQLATGMQRDARCTVEHEFMLYPKGYIDPVTR